MIEDICYNIELSDTLFNSETLHREYEDCIFKNCSFEEVDLMGVVFMNCEFNTCNFTNAKIKDTALRLVEFVDCKMLGLHFTNCNPFNLEINFNACQLDFSSFYQLKLANTRFINCSIKEADFVEADLTKADFSGSNLFGATFEQSNLTKADFRTAINFTINPEVNSMIGAKFSQNNAVGLLEKYNLSIE